jgi:hypothetical protein
MTVPWTLKCGRPLQKNAEVQGKRVTIFDPPEQDHSKALIENVLDLTPVVDLGPVPKIVTRFDIVILLKRGLNEEVNAQMNFRDDGALDRAGSFQGSYRERTRSDASGGPRPSTTSLFYHKKGIGKDILETKRDLLE